MRFCTYNVENLFRRPSVMNQPGGWESGEEVLTDFSSLNSLIGKEKYTAADKTKMLKLITKYKLYSTNSKSDIIYINPRTGLFKKTKQAGLQITATGRPCSLGWMV